MDAWKVSLVNVFRRHLDLSVYLFFQRLVLYQVNILSPNKARCVPHGVFPLHCYLFPSLIGSQRKEELNYVTFMNALLICVGH